MERVYFKEPLRKLYKENRKNQEIAGMIRALQSCAITFEEDEIKDVCRKMLRLSEAEKKRVSEDRKLAVLYANIRGWISQKVKRLGPDEEANREVLNDLLWNVCPYWVELKKGGKNE